MAMTKTPLTPSGRSPAKRATGQARWRAGLGSAAGQYDIWLLLIVAMLTSKGASGITGAGFITLAATLAVVDPRLVPGMAIVLGIDKFMSECRALTNLTGNGIATVIVAWWEGELDHDKLKAGLNKQIDPSDIETAVTTG